ncbi:hypothetical protein DENSPDRAFT_125973 [Dentipellis sp. KUC8613]|nr:hypothetical protein DENSPDRAFT_125973 [Dentipellis sp. KUC8613]
MEKAIGFLAGSAQWTIMQETPASGPWNDLEGAFLCFPIARYCHQHIHTAISVTHGGRVVHVNVQAHVQDVLPAPWCFGSGNVSSIRNISTRLCPDFALRASSLLYHHSQPSHHDLQEICGVAYSTCFCVLTSRFFRRRHSQVNHTSRVLLGRPSRPHPRLGQM